MQQLGITHVLNLAGKTNHLPSSIVCKSVHFKDSKNLNIEIPVEEALSFLNEIKKGKVLVQCMGGISRSTGKEETNVVFNNICFFFQVLLLLI